jgi:hypothetical protein
MIIEAAVDKKRIYICSPPGRTSTINVRLDPILFDGTSPQGPAANISTYINQPLLFMSDASHG